MRRTFSHSHYLKSYKNSDGLQWGQSPLNIWKMASLKSRPFLLKILALLCIVAVLGFGIWNVLLAPSQAPETEFNLIDQQVVTLKSLKGKVVILNFWATDCVSCVAEMPILSEVHQKYESQGLEIIAIALQRDNFKKITQFTQKNALNFKVAYDGGGRIAQQWGPIQATPTTIVVGRNGKVVMQHVGALTLPQFEAMLEKNL